MISPQQIFQAFLIRRFKQVWTMNTKKAYGKETTK